MSEERPPHAPYVFLSYARADRTKARAIVSALEAQGLRIWWDGLVEGGHEFADKIEAMVAGSGPFALGPRRSGGGP